jgi:MFS family permease
MVMLKVRENMDKRIQLPIKELLIEKKYWQWSFALQFIRTPMIMTSLAFIIISNSITGNHSLGGMMVTAYVLSMTVFTIPCGRIIDRIGLHNGLPILLFISSISLFGILVIPAYHLSEYWLIFFAALSGGSIAGVPGAMRSLLGGTVSKEKLPAAIALDATIIEIVVVTAPIIAALSSIWWEPGAILSMIILNIVAGILTRNLTNKIQEIPKIVIQKEHPPLKKYWFFKRRFLFWVFVSISFGHILGTAEIGAIPLVEQFGGGTTGAALLISTLAVCSATSGIVYASIFHKINISHPIQACLLVFSLVLSCLYLAISSSFIHSLFAISLIGFSVAPLMTVRSIAVEEEIPAEHKTEGFSIINTSHTVGFAIGGLLLATLPLFWMIAAGAMSGIITLLLSPFLLGRFKSPQTYSKTITMYNKEN